MALKEIIGRVSSDKMNKTAVITVNSKVRHKKYGKIIYKNKKYYAHDEENSCKVGDTVKIQQARPISKYKRWTVIQLINQ